MDVPLPPLVEGSFESTKKRAAGEQLLSTLPSKRPDHGGDTGPGVVASSLPEPTAAELLEKGEGPDMTAVMAPENARMPESSALDVPIVAAGLPASAEVVAAPLAGVPEPGAPGATTADPGNSHKATSASKGVITLDAGVWEEKGCRPTMEDAWVMMPDARDEKGGVLRCAYFAVFDGHAGRNAAAYAQQHLHTHVMAAGLPRDKIDHKAAKRAITEGFRTLDEALLRQSKEEDWTDGCTAVCVWILDNAVYVANIGDARAVLAREGGGAAGATPGTGSQENEGGGAATPASTAAGTSSNSNSNNNGNNNNNNNSSSNNSSSNSNSNNNNSGKNMAGGGGSLRALVLTKEHKAIYPEERQRIEKAGGFLENGRVCGRVEIARAFGDRPFKKSGMISVPDIKCFSVTPADKHLVLSCDGPWKGWSPQEAVEFFEAQFKVSSGVLSVVGLM
eukprot:jgi/Mesvir1/9175/Mv06914-RA.3